MKLKDLKKGIIWRFCGDKWLCVDGNGVDVSAEIWNNGRFRRYKLRQVKFINLRLMAVVVFEFYRNGYVHSHDDYNGMSL